MQGLTGSSKGIDMFAQLGSKTRRIALIAGFALALGGVSTLPAQATGPVNLIAAATNLTAAGTAVSQIAGPGNFVTISDNVITGGGALPVYFTVGGGTTTTGATSGTIAAGASVGILTPTVGTITVLGYAVTNGAASTTATDTIVITVVASAPGTVYSTSTVYAAPGTFTPSNSTDSIFSVTQPAGTANAATIAVSEVDANGVALLAADAKPIAVTATNALISSPNLAASAIGNTTYITGTPINSTTDFVVSGIPFFGGVATITVAVNGVTLKTYSIKFIGTAAKIVLTAISPVVGIGNSISLLPTGANPIGITANTNAFEVQEFDSNGNVVTVNPSHIVVTSNSPSIATTGYFDGGGSFTLGDIAGGTLTSSTVLGVSVNGVSAGTTTFTATDSSLSLTSLPVTIRVSTNTPTSITMTTDQSTYSGGAPGTLTTVLSTAGGTVPAGNYAVFTGQAISSIALSSGSANLPGVPTATPAVGSTLPKVVGEITVKDDGSYTDSFNAPINDGPVTISATPANASISVTPASFTVATLTKGPGSDSVAAANEANDAANAANDAATAATSSAAAALQADQAASSAATAATTTLTALASQVTSILAQTSAISARLAAILKKLKH